MEQFFSLSGVRDEINKYRKKLSQVVPDNEFEKERNDYIKSILSNFVNSPDEWESKTQVNIGYISNVMMNELKAQDMDKDGLDIVFTTCFRFLLEYYINSPGELAPPYSSMKGFAIHNISGFGQRAQDQIEYALREMPISMLKGMLNDTDFKTVRELPSITKAGEELKTKWDFELDERLKRIEALDSSLKEKEHAFNFVGLHKGFSDLSRMKESEYTWARGTLIGLAIALPLPTIIQTCFFIFSAITFSSPWDLVKIAPAVSLTLLLIYFFRVALKNFNSIRAQIMQIELRKSLCQFIQSYADYSEGKKSKEHNPLERFEEIVFSNIMVMEDKIPSTFDGLEQIAAVLNAMKKN
jgi:hypothetical protein